MNTEKERDIAIAIKLGALEEKYWNGLKEISKEMDVPIEKITMTAVGTLPMHLFKNLRLYRMHGRDINFSIEGNEQQLMEFLKKIIP